METYKDFIMHVGVKGMKWGVWNEETRGKYLGFGAKRAHKSAVRKAEKIVKSENKGGGVAGGFRASKLARQYEQGNRKARKVLVKEAKLIDKSEHSSTADRTTAKRIIAGEKALKKLRRRYGNMPSAQLLDAASVANAYKTSQRGGAMARRRLNKERMTIDIARRGADILDSKADEYMNTLIAEVRKAS